MKNIDSDFNILKAVLTLVLMMTLNSVIAQTTKRMVRVARIEIDPAQIANYKAAVKEIGEVSLKEEPGVLMLYSVVDKVKTNQFTVMEIYADSTAYASHRQTAHFKKYKEATKNMVKSLELTEVDPVFAGVKPGVLNK